MGQVCGWVLRSTLCAYTSNVDTGEDGGAPAELTVDELARAAGTVVSTVRLYQNKGLLPPPRKRGRVGYYGSGHLDRLRAIAGLQERGFSLAGIRELFDGLESGESLGAMVGLGLERSLWSVETPQTMTLAELAAKLPTVEFTPALLRRAVELGLMDLSGDGASVIVHRPSMLHIGSELAALGVPAGDILDHYEQLQMETDAIAARFTALFRRRMWKPFVTRGMSAAQVPALVERLEKLGPLAEAVTTASLRYSLQRAAEAFLSAEAQRLGVAIPRPAGAPLAEPD